MSFFYYDCKFCKGQGCLACPKEAERAGIKYESIPEGGIVGRCNRCKAPVQVATKRRADAEHLRLAKTTKGVCANCAITEFLVNTYPVNMIIDERGPEMLLNPLMRDAFLQSGIMQRADMNIDEVNWGAVVMNWHLPVYYLAKNPRNPYRMGDSAKQKKAREDYEKGQREALEGLAEAFGVKRGDLQVDEERGTIRVTRKEHIN